MTNHQGPPFLTKSHKVIAGNCPNKSQSRSETKSSAERRERRRKGEERKRRWGLKCYGFLYGNGQFDCEKFGYGDMAFIPGTILAGEKRPGEFVNSKRQSDWICISTFKHSKKGRVESNISHILACYLDLDGHPEISISEDVIIQRCNLLGLPLPLIIETSPGRYHVKWYFRVPIGADKLRYWKLVQQALYEAFKDLGADIKALDPVRFLRNENQFGAVNKKYPHKPHVIVREKGVKCSLSQIYHILKKHGFIKQTDRIPLETSRRRLVAFLRLRGGITATYVELSKLTSIPLRTLKLLVSEKVREGVLITKVKGKGKDRKTLFVLKVHKVLFNNYSRLVSRFLSKGACAGTRDLAVFACALELKIKKNNYISLAEVADFLEPGFLLCEIGSHPFTRREFLKCIRSALLSDKYQYRYSHNKLIELGLISPEYKKVDSYTSAVTSDVKPDCSEVTARLNVELSELAKLIAPAFDGTRDYREPSADLDPLLIRLRIMNERRFGKGFYRDDKPAFSSGPDNEDPLLMEIRRRNLERDPDFYKKDVL